MASPRAERSTTSWSGRPGRAGGGRAVQRVYLDYSGFAPVDPRVLGVMRPFLEGWVGNPAARHSLGEEARQAGVPFHLDGVGVIGRLPIAVEAEGVDLLTLGANDLYGPPGVGALWMRSSVRLTPLVLGGGQEGGLRSGTENLAGAVGLGVAAELTLREGPSEAARLEALRDRLVEGLDLRSAALRLVGPRRGRLPQHAGFSAPGVEAERLVQALDLAGISARDVPGIGTPGESSPALRALGLGEQEGAIAFTLGRWTTADEIDLVLAELPPIVERFAHRRISGEPGGLGR